MLTVKQVTLDLVFRCRNMFLADSKEYNMCSVLLDNPDWPIDKQSRWLGWLQGELISKGITTIDEERDFSRPLFHEAYKNEGIIIPKTIEIKNSND